VSCRTLFENGRARLGELSCPAESSAWGRLNAIGVLAHVAFPRTSAIIHQTGRDPVVANPNHVLFYNAHQEYRRALVDPRGYSCLFLGVTPDLLAELVAPARRSRVLPLAETRSDRRTSLLLHLLVAAARSRRTDSLLVEELLYGLLAHVVAAALVRSPGPGDARKPRTRRAHRVLVDEAKCMLTTRMDERLSLDELARALYTSPFHLARVFRAETGSSLHGYRMELRARVAFQRLSERRGTLSELAHELGYSSSSHFSDSFRGVFGVRPSAVERMLEAVGAVGAPEVRTILEAEVAAQT
jgi:AraC family transcriptional regulator